MHRLALIALGALAGYALTGCSGLYRHTVETDAFSLYGNDDPGRLERLADVVDATIVEFRQLFEVGDATIPAPRVIYEEDDLSRARIYTTEMRQEGFYLPMLRLVHLSPRHYSELENDLQDAERVVRHELAHHFLIQLHPESGSRYWLNEGVACALEAPFVKTADGTLVAPLYHQWLHEQAHRTLEDMPRKEFDAALEELLASGWFGFHQSGSKVRNYALSWAFTYYQLQQMKGDFAQRVETLVNRQAPELGVLVPGFRKWLAVDPNVELDRLAEDANLRSWTLRTWLSLTRIDGPRFVAHLRPLLESDDEAYRVEAVALLTRLMNRPVIDSLSRERFLYLRAVLAKRLQDGSHDEQVEIANNIRRSGYSSGYLRPLVSLLPSWNSDLRVAGARALARLSEKPTITDPAFWRDATAEARALEVAEWESWLERRDL